MAGDAGPPPPDWSGLFFNQGLCNRRGSTSQRPFLLRSDFTRGSRFPQGAAPGARRDAVCSQAQQLDACAQGFDFAPPPATLVLHLYTGRGVPLSNPHAPALLEAALPAIAQACTVARGVQRQGVTIEQLEKADHSPVTVADFAVQAVVAHALTTALGPVLLAAEESSASLRRPEQSRLAWKVVEANIVNETLTR